MTRLAGLLLVSSLGSLLAGCDDATPSASGEAAAAAAPALEFGALRIVPRFEVDPLWPKPLPNHWLLGSTIGVSVDSRDHVWIIHRQQSLNLETEASAGKNSPAGTCCMPAPNVIELDAQGNVVRRRIFADMSSDEKDGVPDGMKVDVEGRIYCTGPGGTWVWAPDGTRLGIIRTPEIPANVAFGGPDLRTLFLTARTSVYTLRVTTPGQPHPWYRVRKGSR